MRTKASAASDQLVEQLAGCGGRSLRLSASAMAAAYSSVCSSSLVSSLAKGHDLEAIIKNLLVSYNPNAMGFF